MALEFRTINDEEIQAWYDAVLLGFHAQPVPGIGEWGRPGLEIDRTRAAFDDGRMVATLRTLSGEVTLPGAIVPAALLTQVTVSATHRRRGVLTRMITDDLHDAVDRGDLVSYLVAAEYPIYGRFGYGQAVERSEIVIDSTTTTFLPTVASDSDIVMADPEVWAQGALAVYETVRIAQPGFISIPLRWWRIDAGLLPRPGDDPYSDRLALLRRDGRVVGFLRYGIKDGWEHGRPRATCTVEALLGETSADEAALWRFCCELDWIGTVTAAPRPPGDPVRWFVVDARSIIERDRVDFTWLRVLSPAALAARRYEASGNLTIAIRDRQGLLPPAVRLEVAEDGSAICESTTSAPDIELDAGELASLAMGGASARKLLNVGRIVEHTPGAVDLAERLFRSTTPTRCFAGF